MGRKSKVSNELKIELVKMILEGKGTIQELSKEYNVAKSSLMTWKKKYIEIGEESIKVEDKNRHYWIRDYRKSIDEHGKVSALKKHVRKTIEAKVEAVEFCQNNNYDYNLTIRKFGISYQQIYSWVKKYENGGVDALTDNRGKRRSETKK